MTLIYHLDQAPFVERRRNSVQLGRDVGGAESVAFVRGPIPDDAPLWDQLAWQGQTWREVRERDLPGHADCYAITVTDTIDGAVSFPAVTFVAVPITPQPTPRPVLRDALSRN